MAAPRNRFVTVARRAARTAGAGTDRTRISVWGSAVLVGVVAVAPTWWWHRLTSGAAVLGWRWLPVLLAVAGVIGVRWETSRRWRRVGRERQRVAERVPLFGHVATLLLLAMIVAAAVGAAMWTTLGRPVLGIPASGAAAWSVQNTFDAIKIVLAVVAGIGGVVALTVAYRKQDHGEAAEQRENTKLFNDRFGRAADQLGSDKAAVRLAGVYALAGLADDWPDGRQTCIDVLCAYLRMPYVPAADEPAPADSDAGPNTRQEQQVRHTVLSLIRYHLLPVKNDPRGRPRWHGYQFNLRGAIIDGGNFSGIDLPTGTTLDLAWATFSGGAVNFSHATFSGGLVDFSHAMLVGGAVDFTFARFSGGWVTFGHATFADGAVNFSKAMFSGGSVDFDSAAFEGGRVQLSDPMVWKVPPGGVGASSPGVQWPSEEYLALIGA